MKSQIVYEAPSSSSFGFNVLAETMGHGPNRDERKAKKVLSGGMMLGTGIPVTIVGVSLMVPAFYLLGAAIAVDVAASGLAALYAGGYRGLIDAAGWASVRSDDPSPWML